MCPVLPDPKASNAVVALVGFYSAREAEYDAEIKRKDTEHAEQLKQQAALMRKLAEQAEQQRARADEHDKSASMLEASLATVRGSYDSLLAVAVDLLDAVGRENLNRTAFVLDGERADALRRVLRRVEDLARD